LCISRWFAWLLLLDSVGGFLLVEAGGFQTVPKETVARVIGEASHVDL
jgi:hypothetical protein